MNSNIKTMKIIKCKDVRTPEIGRLNDCGYDMFVPNDFKKQILKPHQQIKIPLGIKFNIQNGYGLFCFDRSSVSTKIGLKVIAPVIDPSYIGEISACVFNYTNKDVELNPGMKIIQLVLLKYEKPQLEVVEDFGIKTERGEKGFGSTGNNSNNTNKFSFKKNNKTVEIIII